MDDRHLQGLQPQHVPRTSAWSLLVVEHHVYQCRPHRSLGHGRHYSSWQQHRLKASTWSLGQHGPRTPIWSLVADPPVVISVASGHSTDQGYLHFFDDNEAHINTAPDPLTAAARRTPTWRQAAVQAIHIGMAPAATSTTDTNTASCGSTDYGGLLRGPFRKRRPKPQASTQSGTADHRYQHGLQEQHGP